MNSTYSWDSVKNIFITNQIDIAKYLLNINNDICVFEFIKPRLIELNTKKSRSFVEEYIGTVCQSSF